MEINLQGGARVPTALPARSADFPVVQKTETDTGTANVLQVEIPANDAIEAQRLANVQAAAESMFKDIYVVSDARFTIYKDGSGQYITRYTSLRDGKITYIPEPNMLQYMERQQQARQALLEIQA
jgi:hypothetical protein